MKRPRATAEGARLLRAFLTETDQTVPEFSERHGFGRIQLQRLLNGERLKVSVDFAEAIQMATGGRVPWNSWCQYTRRPPVDDLEDPRPSMTGTDGR